MAYEAKLDVSRWQPSRRGWSYVPALWFWFRIIEQAYLDARSQKDGKPNDEGLLARDWIARSEPGSWQPGKPYVSFPECCEVLGLKAGVERAALLERIDAAVDSDTDDAWKRLETLSSADPEDDAEAVFEGLRVVPAVDQLQLF